MDEKPTDAVPFVAFSSTVTGISHGDFLIITIDNSPVNALSHDVRSGLLDAITAAEADHAIQAVMITGAGKNFVGGADIREFGQPPREPHLPDLLNRIERCTKQVVAAINGPALGGGCELALACHYRLATSNAKLGLPEVKLGIVPGAGGTQRLPRLVGLVAAVDLIGSGRLIGAREAQDLGLIDTIADGDLTAPAVNLLPTLLKNPPRRTSDQPVSKDSDNDVDLAAKKITAKSRGQKAPIEAVRLVRLAAERSFEEGLADERATFLKLRDSEEAAALRHIFFAERAASKVEGLDGIAPNPVQTIGIVGTGLMGSGIAISALAAGFNVIAVEQSVETAQAGRERITALLDRSLASGRLGIEAHAAQINRLLVTSDTEQLSRADMVIEAVFDDLDVKIALFQRLDNIVRQDAILATNTSYLNPDEIAAATRHPERVVGLHFFSPAHIMRLVEVVRCAQSSPSALATALAVSKRLGKLAVTTGVCEGFIGNRIFSAYRQEAEFLLEEGALPEQIDNALEEYGFPMGLFAVNDLAGLQIAWARRKRQAATRNPGDRYVDIADRLCEAGRFGQKTGFGWYAYENGKRKVDPDVTAIIEASRAAKNIVAQSFTADEIMVRLLAAMSEEGKALCQEGIAARASDIDLVMVNGYGFPAHKGGPMFAASRNEPS